MDEKRRYHTKRRDEILRCIEGFDGRHFTAADVAAKLTADGSTVGPATVYRTIDRLAEEGILRKYVIDGTTAACYQKEAASGGDCREHFHLKCESCGRLFHTECRELSRIAAHIREDHGFRLNSARTVFYGTCADCLAGKKEKSPRGL